MTECSTLLELLEILDYLLSYRVGYLLKHPPTDCSQPRLRLNFRKSMANDFPHKGHGLGKSPLNFHNVWVSHFFEHPSYL